MAGRIKELIIRGGENISPVQIEDCLLEQDKRIVQAKVLGIPDEHYGEEICACIILKQGETMSEEEVRDIARKNLASFKVPKYVLFFDTFPTSSQGKILRGELLETAVARIRERGSR
jgi:fatty-acyl-CoA synthase